MFRRSMSVLWLLHTVLMNANPARRTRRAAVPSCVRRYRVPGSREDTAALLEVSGSLLNPPEADEFQAVESKVEEETAAAASACLKPSTCSPNRRRCCSVGRSAHEIVVRQAFDQFGADDRSSLGLSSSSDSSRSPTPERTGLPRRTPGGKPFQVLRAPTHGASPATAWLLAGLPIALAAPSPPHPFQLGQPRPRSNSMKNRRLSTVCSHSLCRRYVSEV